VSLTSSEFREHFFKQYNDIPRKDRKERLKKYGHLNLKSSEEKEDQVKGEGAEVKPREEDS